MCIDIYLHRCIHTCLCVYAHARTHTHTRPCIRYVVMFDLRHYPETVVIGIGQQDPSYIPAKKHAAISKLPARKRAPLSVAATHAPPGYKMPYARDRLPITNQVLRIYLSIYVSIYLCIYLCIYVSIYLSICIYICI